MSATKLAEIVGISKRKIEENMAKLKKMGLIERVGGTRGYWDVLDMKNILLKSSYLLSLFAIHIGTFLDCT